ncbi:MAG: lactonase family protein [Planctomycetaceae bacterium]
MSEEVRLFVGTYTRGNDFSQGIYTCTFNDASGKLSDPVLAASADNPSFLAIHPNGQWLYACNETGDFQGTASGAVSAYRIGSGDGGLTLLNQQATGGGAPCHCNIDATGKFLLVANYSGGNVSVFPIDDDGRLKEHSCLLNHTGSGPNKTRQEAPHAHSVNLSSDNRYAYVADLGIDRIMIYRFDAEAGRLVPSAADSALLPPGAGPRHFCIHPSQKFAYTNHELTSEVTAFERNRTTGALTAIQTVSTLPEGDQARRSTAECLVDPSGRYLYVSNRGHDSIAAYSIDQNSGRLTLVEIRKTGGEEPRNFVISANGRWLIAENQNSNTVCVFAVNRDTGALVPTEHRIQVGRPVCIRFMP